MSGVMVYWVFLRLWASYMRVVMGMVGLGLEQGMAWWNPGSALLGNMDILSTEMENMKYRFKILMTKV